MKRLMFGLALMLTACGEEAKDSGFILAPGFEGGGFGSIDSGFSPLLDTGMGDSCGIELVHTVPVADSIEAYHGEPIEMVLSMVDPTATIELRNANGSMPGTLEFFDERIRFTPAPGMEVLQDYMVFLSWCGGHAGEQFSFSTSDLGSPLTVDSLTDFSYGFQMKQGRWNRPFGLAPLIVAEIQANLLMGIQVDATDRMEVTLASSVPHELVQDFCMPSLREVPAVDISTRPVFKVPESDFFFLFNNIPFRLYNGTLEGVFAPDGASIEYGELNAIVDVRDIAILVNQPAQDICNIWLPDFQESCEPCPDGQNYCVPLNVSHLHADRTGKEIQCVDEFGCHPECGANDPFVCPPPHEMGFCE